MEQVYTVGFEALLTHFQHIMKIQAGMETLHEDIDFDGPLGEESEYATTVLKLNDIDLKELAGQEGFMDGLKRAGGKIKEFIKQLIAYIRNYFKPKEIEVQEVEKFIQDIQLKRDRLGAIKEATDLAVNGTIPESIKKLPKSGTFVGDLNKNRVARSEQIRDRVRRLPNEDRTAVKEAADLVGGNADIQDKVAMLDDNIRLRVNNTINRFAKTALNAIKEIERIDPTKETTTLLKIDMGTPVDSIVRLAKDSENTSTDIEDNIRLLCMSRGIFSSTKDKATRELEHMSNRGDYDDRVLSRATSVLQELVKVVESLCNGVLSVDAVIRKTEGEALDKITKEIFRRAASQMGGDVSKALSELNSIAGM